MNRLGGLAVLCAATACGGRDAEPPPAARTPNGAVLDDRAIDVGGLTFGLAENRNGAVCLAIPVALQVGSVVTLVPPGLAAGMPARVTAAHAASCTNDSTGVGVAELGDSLYSLAGAAIGPGSVYIAVRGASEQQLSGLAFRECTSNEGVHFTVWSGEPLTGTRIWHRYYHLDYDTEPNCTEAEYREPEADSRSALPWWLHAQFNPTDTVIEGLPIHDLDTSWVAAFGTLRH